MYDFIGLRARKKRRKPRLKGKLGEAARYHKKKKIIDKTILDRVDDKEVIYGARALNKRFPGYLKKPTTDYDIFSTSPLKDAREAERALDRKFGFNAFRVEPAQHKGTYKVKSNITGEGVADYTKPEKKIPYDKINGKKYVKISWVKERIGQILKDKESAYRHDKDRDALSRIRIYEKLHKKR